MKRMPFCLVAATTILSAGGTPVTAADSSQVHYFVPKSVVELRLTKESKRRVAPESDLSARSDKADVSVEYERGIGRVADTSKSFAIDFQPEAFKKKDIDVRLSSLGLLASVNGSSQGQAATAITNVIKGVASLAALLVGLDAEPGGPAPWPPPAADCLATPLGATALEIQAVIRRSPEGCRLWLALDRNRRDLDDWSTRLRVARGRLEKARPESFEQELAVVRQLEKEVAALGGAREGLLREFDDAREAFVKNQGLGTTTKIEKRSYTFELSEIPSEKDLAKLREPGAPGADDVLRRMKEAFAWSGVALSLDEVGSAAPGGKSSGSPGRLTIHYRRARPFRLVTWKTVKGVLTPDDVSLVELCVGGDDVSSTELHLSAWGDRALRVEFDAGGQPTLLAASSSASAVAVTSLLAEAGSAAMSAYTNSLGQVLEAQKAQDALGAQRLTSELDELKRRKEVLDATTSLSVGQATSADLQKRQEIDAQISRLEAEISLRQTQGTADLRVDVAVLKAEVEKLNLELNRLKAEKELEKAGK